MENVPKQQAPGVGQTLIRRETRKVPCICSETDKRHLNKEAICLAGERTTPPNFYKYPDTWLLVSKK